MDSKHAWNVLKRIIENLRKEVINMPNYYPDIHVERCNNSYCNKPVDRGLGINKKTGIKYLTYLEYCKEHNN